MSPISPGLPMDGSGGVGGPGGATTVTTEMEVVLLLQELEVEEFHYRCHPCRHFRLHWRLLQSIPSWDTLTSLMLSGFDIGVEEPEGGVGCTTPVMLFSNAGTSEPDDEAFTGTGNISNIGGRDGWPLNPTISPLISPASLSALGALGGNGAGSSGGAGAGNRLGAVGGLTATPLVGGLLRGLEVFKSYITHGSYNFALPKDLEHVQVLLERKRKDRAVHIGYCWLYQQYWW
ncbi:hypothetical protein K435DRAFT_791189 [Dendrothele bispora CBS 962.96]|uniref:Uncharacterized protein n=1 Tax=Dendrothele bispora (strain CBS 962.96) TaxID=1314807 RepID=A0A4S8MN01_DENBC|nr:hypothetical protein K435DRAFT_791189 [Dendrothele bispora CBS 962.96]